jgi:hypothetical protein
VQRVGDSNNNYERSQFEISFSVIASFNAFTANPLNLYSVDKILNGWGAVWGAQEERERVFLALLGSSDFCPKHVETDKVVWSAKSEIKWQSSMST